MKLKLMTAVTGLFISGLAIADTYQMEVGASASRYDNDLISSDTKSYTVDGTYYFKPVKTDNLPLAEAAYLGKSSNVFANIYEQPKQDHTPEWNVFTLGAEIYIPENFLYVQAGVHRRSSQFADRDDWFTAVGITPIEGLLLTTYYDNDAGYDANLHAKYVTAIGSGQAVNLEASVTDADHDTDYSLGGDFYFDNTFSVGAAVDSVASEDAYTLRTTKFFTDKFSGSLAYTDAKHENETMLAVSLRF